MAPTAAMLLLSHNSKTHAPSATMPPSSSYCGLKGPALKWVARYNAGPTEGSQKNVTQTQTSCIVDPSAKDKRLEEALQLCSC
ncbi:hypothetical protein RJT34_04255 [Clitoria ternatea]|uniref:Uncharacterized protein n=1 Tax=Clitoria ternatea TaxID=43366 RepID=A0AAN9Q5Y2_CLITE